MSKASTSKPRGWHKTPVPAVSGRNSLEEESSDGDSDESGEFDDFDGEEEEFFKQYGQEQDRETRLKPGKTGSSDKKQTQNVAPLLATLNDDEFDKFLEEYDDAELGYMSEVFQIKLKDSCDVC